MTHQPGTHGDSELRFKLHFSVLPDHTKRHKILLFSSEFFHMIHKTIAI